MALQRDYDQPETGAVFPGAYHRVNGLSVDTIEKRLTVHMAVYADAARRQAGKAPVAVGNVEGDYAAIVAARTASDPVARAYDWLKQQPNYAGAVDV